MERQSGYGFFVAVIALSNHFKAVENALQYLRLSAAMGHRLTDLQAAHIKRELGVAERATVYVQNLMEGELSKLKHKARPTPKDDQIVAELMKAARGEGNCS
jgi:hypothetical protein